MLLKFESSKWLTIITLCSVLGACSQSSTGHSNQTFSDDKQAVVNGNEVTYPEALYKRVLHLLATEEFTDESGTKLIKSSHCSASAISKRLILTAGHCVFYKKKDQRIQYKTPEKTLEFKVVDGVVHWRWEMSQRSHDIAVLLLEKDLPEEIEILKLPEKAETLPDFIEAAGYGRSDGRLKPEKSGVGVLRSKMLKVSSKSVHDPKFTVEQFEGGVCQGDSGSPAMSSRNGQTFVLGVLSETSQLGKKKTDDPNPELCSTYANYTLVSDEDILSFIASASEELLKSLAP